MIRKIIAIITIFILYVLITSWVLSVDDISHCGGVPGVENGCEEAGAIVAISGGDTRARALEAIELYYQKWAPMIVFSGAASDKSGPSNAAVMREIALERGIPAEDIRIDEVSKNTKENAKETKTIFEVENISSVIVVTSGYHVRRAVFEFEKNTSNAMQVRGHSTQKDKDWNPYWWWVNPKSWWLATGELLKNTYISVRGA